MALRLEHVHFILGFVRDAMNQPSSQATWQVNCNFTFTASTTISAWAESWRYMLAVLGDGVVNYLFFTLTVSVLPPSSLLPLIAVAVGWVGGMVVNFVSTKVLVFCH
jgi:putative flippase GtrA